MKRKLLAVLLTGMLVVSSLALVACRNDDGGAGEAPAVVDDTDDPDPANGDDPDPAPVDVGDRVEIEFWNGFTGADGQQMEVIVQDFNNSQDEIHVTMQLIPWGEYWESITVGVQTGIMPHVGAIHFDDLPKFAYLDVIIPADNIVDMMGLTAADFPDGYWEASLYEGHIWGIPLDFHPVVMFYNRAILEEAGIDVPTTGDEFIAAATALTGDGQWGVAIPVDSNGFMRMVFSRTLLHQFGGHLVNPDGLTYAFNSPEGVQALQLLVDFIHYYEISPPEVDSAWEMFTAGLTAFHFDGPWNILGFDANEDLDYGIASFPQFGPNYAVWAGSHQLSLMNVRDATPEETHAAEVFIAYVIENSVEWARAGQVPALNRARYSEEFLAMERLQPIAAMFDYMVLCEYPSPWWGDGFDYIFSDELVGALLGTMGVQEALDNSVEFVNAMTAELAARFGRN